MQLDINKFELAQARTGKTLRELGISRDFILRARNGSPIKPVSVYKIANALGVDPAEIVKGGDQ